MELVYK